MKKLLFTTVILCLANQSIYGQKVKKEKVSYGKRPHPYSKRAKHDHDITYFYKLIKSIHFNTLSLKRDVGENPRPSILLEPESLQEAKALYKKKLDEQEKAQNNYQLQKQLDGLHLTN